VEPSKNLTRSGRIIFRLVLLFGLVSWFGSAQGQSTVAPESGTGIEGMITIGPAHGGPSRVGVPDSKPLANVAFTVKNDKDVMPSFTTDAEGRFKVSLPPGHYTVSRTDAQSKIGRYGPFEVDVVAGRMTPVNWSCDSGIR
jgi:hypothetical protein